MKPSIAAALRHILLVRSLQMAAALLDNHAFGMIPSPATGEGKKRGQS
jgi:hypothetical protein